MPRTPSEVRERNTRTPPTGKRTHLPPRAASSTSCRSVATSTPIRWSPSSSFIAILPPAGTKMKSASALRRILPLEVANTTLRSS